MDKASKSHTRDTVVLSLNVLRTTKALLTSLKEEYDTPQGRLIDRAIEELAVKLLGKAQVERVKNATRDQAKKLDERASVRSKTKVKSGRSGREDIDDSVHVSFLRDDGSDEPTTSP